MCGREAEYLENTHAAPGRTCNFCPKLNKSPQTRQPFREASLIAFESDPDLLCARIAVDWTLFLWVMSLRILRNVNHNFNSSVGVYLLANVAGMGVMTACRCLIIRPVIMILSELRRDTIMM